MKRIKRSSKCRFRRKVNRWNDIKKVTTNSKGYALAENLQPGTYVITEVTAPPGYEKSANEIRVTIPFNPQKLLILLLVIIK